MLTFVRERKECRSGSSSCVDASRGGEGLRRFGNKPSVGQRKEPDLKDEASCHKERPRAHGG